MTAVLIIVQTFEADDCFELGRQLYKKEDFHHAISWLKEALKRLHESQEVNNRTAQWEILEYLSHSLYMEGTKTSHSALMVYQNLSAELNFRRHRICLQFRLRIVSRLAESSSCGAEYAFLQIGTKAAAKR